jgi:hypothetical protein
MCTRVGKVSDLEFTDKRYLDILLKMDVSLHSMEVVNRVVMESNATLPTHFIKAYISHCIKQCQHCSDRFMQSRQVRLVSQVSLLTLGVCIPAILNSQQGCRA